MVNVMVSNGFISSEALDILLPLIDAWNIDLKGWDPDFYRNICGAARKPVLETIQRTVGKSHVELTNLVIPGKNDDPATFEEMVKWIRSLNQDIPLHITRFFPCWNLTDCPPTPLSTLVSLGQIARKYLSHVKKRNSLERAKGDSASQGEKAAIVQELRAEGYRLTYLLKAMELSRSTYYFEIGKKDLVTLRNEGLVKTIVAIFNKNKGRYGVRRVHHELIHLGYKVNHKRVYRLMRMAGLMGKRPREKGKYKSYKGCVGKVAKNIINRDFAAEKPLQKWTTDITQFNFSWGKCYLSPILDMATNEVIAYDLSLSPNLEQIKRMLNKAFERYPHLEGLIFHSDQGWQYQHDYYQNALKEHGITQSMSRKGNCYDNSIMESFFGRMKNEMYYDCEDDFASFDEFSQAVKKYIDYYNNERIQAKTKWMSPVEYRKASLRSA